MMEQGKGGGGRNKAIVLNEDYMPNVFILDHGKFLSYAAVCFMHVFL